MAKPIYQQVIDVIYDEIKNMPANTPILSERELAQQTGASRMTVRKAIKTLVDEGLLYTDKTKGTYVADSKMHKRKSDHLFKSDGLTHKILHYDIKDSVIDIAKLLEIELQDSFVKLVRLNVEAGHPISLDEIYIVRKMIRNFDPMEINNYLNFEQFLQSGSINQAFIPMIVPVQYAKLLDLKLQSPIIVIESRICTPQGRVYAFIKTFSNPERMNIEITL